MPTPTPTPTPLPAVDVSGVAAADPGSALPAGWQHGVFMQIFVRSYKDSDGDGIGDLRGLTQQLDYLRDLGVRGLWLMPVTRSQDHDHGYAVTDYRNIETQYGSLADLDALLTQAHARGIGVILDYVMNHSAAQHPLFVNSMNATTNPYRNWYVWQAAAPSGWVVLGGNPWRGASTGAYYGAFSAQMPDFNLTNEAVINWHQDNLRFWLNRGVDGFRFDAVGNLVENGPTAFVNQPESYAIMRGVATVLGGYARRTMVCEAPDDPAGFGRDCGGAFAFGHQIDLIDAARGNATSLQKVADYPLSAPAGMASFLSNHDSFAGDRPWDQLGGNVARLKLAAGLNLLMPHTPFIYYGEEVGMNAGSGLAGDARLRSPMSWTANAGGFTSGTPYRALAGNVATQNVAAQTADPASLLNFYKAMLALRNTRASIAQGSYTNAMVNGSVLSFLRTATSGETTLVVVNTATVPLNVPVGGLPASARLTDLHPGTRASVSANGAGIINLDVSELSINVYDVQP